MHICMRVYVYMYISTLYLYMCIYAHICIYICICNLYMYICIYACVYICIHIHTFRSVFGRVLDRGTLLPASYPQVCLCAHIPTSVHFYVHAHFKSEGKDNSDFVLKSVIALWLFMYASVHECMHLHTQPHSSVCHDSSICVP